MIGDNIFNKRKAHSLVLNNPNPVTKTAVKKIGNRAQLIQKDGLLNAEEIPYSGSSACCITFNASHGVATNPRQTHSDPRTLFLFVFICHLKVMCVTARVLFAPFCRRLLSFYSLVQLVIDQTRPTSCLVCIPFHSHQNKKYVTCCLYSNIFMFNML